MNSEPTDNMYALTVHWTLCAPTLAASSRQVNSGSAGTPAPMRQLVDTCPRLDT
jgi:hypothetical protein